MFSISTVSKTHFRNHIIEGCPSDGLSAIDFRRAHGLLGAPTNCVEFEARSWVDEFCARQLPLNSAGDYHLPECDGHLDPGLLAMYLLEPTAVSFTAMAVDAESRADGVRRAARLAALEEAVVELGAQSLRWQKRALVAEAELGALRPPEDAGEAMDD